MFSISRSAYYFNFRMFPDFWTSNLALCYKFNLLRIWVPEGSSYRGFKFLRDPNTEDFSLFKLSRVRVVKDLNYRGFELSGKPESHLYWNGILPIQHTLRIIKNTNFKKISRIHPYFICIENAALIQNCSSLPKVMCWPASSKLRMRSKRDTRLLLSNSRDFALLRMLFKLCFNFFGASGSRMWKRKNLQIFIRFVTALWPTQRRSTHGKVRLVEAVPTMHCSSLSHVGSSLSTSSMSDNLISPLTSTNWGSLKSRMRSDPRGECSRYFTSLLSPRMI